MGRIDDAIRTLEATANATDRALQLAGLISTLFKIKGVILVVTDQLALDSYASSESEKPEVELAAFAGKLAPRIVLEIMREQLHAKGSLYHWNLAGIPVRLREGTVIVHRELCRDFMTDHGMVKLLPAEEITADCILAAVYPEPDLKAQKSAHRLLFNGLAEAFRMDWAVLQSLCDRPDYRVGEDLARMRLAAKRDVDAKGMARDHVGDTTALPSVKAPPAQGTAASSETVDPLY